MEEAVKYEKISRIVIIGLLVVIIGLFTGTCFLQYRLGRTRSELNECRNQLEYASNREQELEYTIGSVRETVGRTNQILSQSTTTISQIRSQISQIREQYIYMEDLLNNINSSNSGTNNRVGNSSEVEDGKD